MLRIAQNCDSHFCSPVLDWTRPDCGPRVSDRMVRSFYRSPFELETGLFFPRPDRIFRSELWSQLAGPYGLVFFNGLQIRPRSRPDRTMASLVLSSMWTFVYKTDKHTFLSKCKARLVVCGNQQERGELPTRATTLASTAFRTLMAITAKFDLETIQIDAVNAFVYCDLDEVVYMKLPPRFTVRGFRPSYLIGAR